MELSLKNVLMDPHAKWYLKYCLRDLIDAEIEKQKSWKNISRSTMWIIDWDI